MGLEVPPLPVSYKIFKERWEAGARTMEELDPDLMDYINGSRKDTKISKWLVGCGIFLLLLSIFIAVYAMAMS